MSTTLIKRNAKKYTAAFQSDKNKLINSLERFWSEDALLKTRIINCCVFLEYTPCSTAGTRVIIDSCPLAAIHLGLWQTTIFIVLQENHEDRHHKTKRMGDL